MTSEAHPLSLKKQQRDELVQVLKKAKDKARTSNQPSLASKSASASNASS